MTKTIRKAILGSILLLLVLAYVIYAIYLTPRQRAAAHLEYIHNSINEMHPAILEEEATAFNTWNKAGYQKAKALLSAVNSQADELALLNFYLAGYKDAHLGGSLNHTPYRKFEFNSELWAGWLLKATNTGYIVAYSKGDENSPPLNARLISCDNKAIDELLQENYAPYIDSRWNILKARDSAAKALTLDRADVAILNRPKLKNCTFLIGESSRSYPLNWSTISASESAAINAQYQHPYHLPFLEKPAPDIAWIHASDFSLFTPEAVKAQQKLLQDIAALPKDNALIILDTRGNGGGSSMNGQNIMDAIFTDKQANEYLYNNFNYRYQGANAIFRASWPLYWSEDYSYKRLVANQGEESEQAQYLKQFLIRLKHALDTGEKQLYQNETPVTYSGSAAPTDAWRSSIKLVLITDKHCVSACLDFVDLIKLIPNTLHVGEPTDADTVYTEIAYMQSNYAKETFNFIVPVKKWTKRIREDNKPYNPDILYQGDMSNDKALEQWTIEKAKQYFKLNH